MPRQALDTRKKCRGKSCFRREARENFCAVARKYRRVVSFLYGDGKVKYREKKKVLGLHGDSLPAMAMNTADGRVLTYDEV